MSLGLMGNQQEIYMTTNFSAATRYIGAKLYLYGSELNPRRVEEVLGLKGDKSFQKGDKFAALKETRSSGMWSLDFHGDGRTFSEDLIEILNNIPADLRPLSNIPGVQSARISILLEYNAEFEGINDRSLEIEIDESDIRGISQLEAQIYITYLT